MKKKTEDKITVLVLFISHKLPKQPNDLKNE